MLRQGRILVILVYSCFVLINAVNNRRIEKEEGEGSANPIPVVLWHGMNDSCCDPLKMGWIKQTIETQVPGIFVYSVEVTFSSSWVASFWPSIYVKSRHKLFCRHKAYYFVKKYFE